MSDDARTLDRLRRICLAFPEADESTLQDRPLFHVRRRRFAIFNGADAPARPRWAGAGCSLHFLTDPAERDALRAEPRVRVSPHHGDRGWMSVSLDVPPDWAEITELLESAYRTAAPNELVVQLDAAR